MLIAKDLSVTLGKRQILSGISFECRPKELTAIVGPNGCGKTTTLRALAGDLPYRGQALLNGAEISGATAQALAEMRAVLSQSTQISFPFTVREIVRLGLPSGAGEGAVLQALADMGLSAQAGQILQHLSGGQQARVHLARALLQVWQPVGPDGPRWLYLDEPVAALDIGQQLAVMQRARRFANEGGGVVAVMHDLNLSAMFADQVILMRGGAILAKGPPQEVLTDRNLAAAYECQIRVNQAPQAGAWVLPQSALG